MGTSVERRHYYGNPTKSKSEIPIALALADCVLKLGKVRIEPKAFYWFPSTPLGYHISIHDVDERYPQGVVHQRIGPQGAFRRFPGNVSLGNLIPLRRIPAFGQLEGVIPLQPEGIQSAGWAPLRVFREQQSRVAEHGSDQAVTFKFTSHTEEDSMLWEWVLVREDNMQALDSWLDEQQSFWNKPILDNPEFGKTSLAYLDIFHGPECCLASIVGIRKHWQA